MTILAVTDSGMHLLREVHAVPDLFEVEISIYEKKSITFLKVKEWSSKYMRDVEM